MSSNARAIHMSLKHEVRRAVRRFGFDVVRYSSGSGTTRDPIERIVKLLKHHHVAVVVDVGANDGGFASSIRQRGYSGRIISFEPLDEPYKELRRKADLDGNWEAVQTAVGDEKRTLTMNISGNAALSSSVLPMLDTHTSAAPESLYIGSQTVTENRLDNLLPDDSIAGDRTFLKIDVQGYERAVLEGASRILGDGNLVGLQLELSLVPLYEGAMTYREGFDYAVNLGMTPMGLDPVFADPRTGQLLQVDAVFFRSTTNRTT